MSDFIEFPKIARLSREAIITEKLDGTNACVFIAEGEPPVHALAVLWPAERGGTLHYIAAGSRTKWITPADDNYGFAKWVHANADELFELGVGRHFGEWWGQGIQRKYGMTEKRFSLFNAMRWCAHDAEPALIPSLDPRAEPKYQQRVPTCCHVVPVLVRGTFDTDLAEIALDMLRVGGSRAAPGYRNPEGIVVFHTAAGVGFKKTLDKDELPKGAR